MNTCKVHPNAPVYTYVDKDRVRTKCKRCNVERVTETRRKNKRTLVERAGGACVRCGYNKCVEAMDFHHEDPSQKDFAISGKGSTRSIEKAWEEAKKCLLLCSNCHREEHARLDKQRSVRDSNS